MYTIYTRCRIDTINSPDDEYMSARNMWKFGINIYEKKRNVGQVGHLQELLDLKAITVKKPTACRSHFSNSSETIHEIPHIV